MSEEQTPVEGSQEITSFVEPDGSLKDGWIDQVVPEEHRKNTTWLGIKNVKDFVNQTTHLQSKLTTQGKGVFPLKQDSSPEHIREYRQAFGIPESPDQYGFEVPKEVEQYYDPELVNGFKSVAHQHNLTPTQYTAVMAFYANMVKESTEAVDKDPEAFYAEILPKVQEAQRAKAEEQLKKEWGDAYKTRLALADHAITDHIPEGEKRLEMLERIGNDPLIADLLATIHLKHFTESNGVDTSLGGGNAALNVDQKIEEINKQLTPELKINNRSKFDALLKQKSELYSTRYST